HKDQVITAAEAGKHILCEKPIATSYEDGLAITRAVAANGVRMTMGFNMRFRSPFRKLKEIYAAGTVGQAISYWTTRMGPGNPTGENWRTTPGLLCGITIESVSHDIDLLRWICGEVTSVHGQIRNATTIDGYNDNMCAVMSLANGAMANFHVSWASAIGFNSRGIIGTEGAVSVDGDGIWKLSRIRLKTASSASEAVTEISADEATNMAYQEEGQHFVDCLESGEAFLVTEQDGLAALKVSLGIHKSSETGCVVSLSE
ncbi:MAG: Gfo/Idh/MocA family oxidoreductase, partial [Candidatus Poribacteria bacterium]|nr:Gfo/Idh/MocA family oxidoreductase [Candidatus Poribacteria bacterium]